NPCHLLSCVDQFPDTLNLSVDIVLQLSTRSEDPIVVSFKISLLSLTHFGYEVEELLCIHDYLPPF
ncbi:hypothetical protein ACQUWZ_25770, partial [Ralstonia pseudosolanacearum]|uniref:hypothetical protein n=1 Tax=Ralstonia pseudosolanacearum TaxID=1310165 RepID=UPI003D1764F2